LLVGDLTFQPGEVLLQKGSLAQKFRQSFGHWGKAG
jgi:hypothetical protein